MKLPRERPAPATSKQLARRARAEFVKAKKREMRQVQNEILTPGVVVTRLRKVHERLLGEYLRTKGTTYQTWIEHGPRADLDEVLAATDDPHLFGALVERVLARPA